MSAIKLHDKTIIYSRNVERGLDCWHVGNFKFCAPGEPSRYVDDESWAISDDAIETVIHLLRGGKKREEKKYEQSQSRDGAPTPA